MYNLQHSQFHMLSLFTCRQKYGKMNSNVAYFYNMEHKNDDYEEDVSAEDDEEDDLQNARSREKFYSCA